MTGRPPLESGKDAAQHEAAARVRAQRPGWVVIWVPRKAEFQARPGFRSRWADTVATGSTPEELAAAMDKIRPAARE